jgi:NAD(P)-dependent dehydrogenase (short-subunit alcohol dehydrogenase family)
MQERLKGKVIVVAGAGEIGSALAKRYASEGARVLVGDINETAARRVADEIASRGGEGLGVALDGADEASVGAFFERAVVEFGGIDGVHINFATFADGAGGEDILSLPLATYDEVMRINARGFVLCTRAAVPALLKRGGGSIVYTSSAAAHDGSSVRGAYAMSKAAVNALMRHVARRFGAEGLRANAIAPGVVIYPTIAHHLEGDLAKPYLNNMALRYFAAPEDMTGLAALLMSDDGRYITGQVISADGGRTMRP